MKFRLGNRKAESWRKPRLPAELHKLILIECINDPLISLRELVTLRLVCKQFDEIVASKVLSSICLFRNSDSVLTNLLGLETFLSSKRTPYARTAKTLQIPDWYWIHGCEYFVPWNEMPLVLVFLLLNTLLALGYFVRPFVLPHTMPRVIYKSVLRLYARLRLGALFKPTLNLPEVKKFIWKVRKEPNWVFAATVRMLQGFPQLDELVLDVDEDLPNIGNFIYCMKKLNNFRKLRINFNYYPGSVDTSRNLAINKIGKIIAANPNLTHLELYQDDNGDNIDLRNLFGYIPKNRPLKLEHIAIRSAFWGSVAMTPHIHSLSSFHFSESQYVKTLLAAEIFPPIMSFETVDEHTIEYLDRHPRITSLSFPKGGVNVEIFEIMARHSETLTEYGAYPGPNYWSLNDIRYEILLLKCIHLKRIVVHSRRQHLDDNYDQDETEEMAATLSVISRLDSSPDMIFAGFGDFKACHAYCRGSSNPLLRSLATRMLYDGPRRESC